jgi:hypothetical protein
MKATYFIIKDAYYNVLMENMEKLSNKKKFAWTAQKHAQNVEAHSNAMNVKTIIA